MRGGGSVAKPCHFAEVPVPGFKVFFAVPVQAQVPTLKFLPLATLIFADFVCLNILRLAGNFH